MIEYISGRIADLSPTWVVVETAGIGYLLNISLPCYTALEGQSEARLLVHESIREDAWTLYGFIDERERSLFRLLISVSGVGANTARMLLSSLSVQELESAILSGDVRRLKGVKGIGAKTAERIIVDLKDKINGDPSTLNNMPAERPQAMDEALAAMVMLGFPKAAASKALHKIFDSDPSTKTETAIKKALTML